MGNAISRLEALDMVRDVCSSILCECDTYSDGEDEVYADIREANAVLKCNKKIREALRKMPSSYPEVTFCKDCRKHNVKVGFDENLHTVWKEDACPLVDWRGKAQGHEFDYQYCAYAERRA